MKLAIFSDSHGNTSGMVSAVRRVCPDVLVHLGDYIRDTSALKAEFPLLPFYSVPGNCDFSSKRPETITFMAGQVTVFATHGHRYSVKQQLDALLNAAHFSGASLVLYGHTHIAHCEQIAGMNVLNPGTAGTGSAPTFAVVEIADKGGVACRILSL